MLSLRRFLSILFWAPRYERTDLRSDLAAGLTVGAMLVAQAMAYALPAGLPPEVGLYAAAMLALMVGVVHIVLGAGHQGPIDQRRHGIDERTANHPGAVSDV